MILDLPARPWVNDIAREFPHVLFLFMGNEEKSSNFGIYSCIIPVHMGAGHVKRHL
jgi:hypothetical protein